MEMAKGVSGGTGSPFLQEGTCAGGGSGLTQRQSPVAPSPHPLPGGTQSQSTASFSREGRESSEIQVSIILPVYNAECWLDECLKSVLEQDFQGSMELSVFNDASMDNSGNILKTWKVLLEEAGIQMVLGENDSSQPRGVGFAKNHAIDQSSGTYLCFLDSDDVMMPQRIRLQWEAAIQHPESIIGCQIEREPAEATERYTRWINNLTCEQLLTQLQRIQGQLQDTMNFKTAGGLFCFVIQFSGKRSHCFIPIPVAVKD
ncbi:UDP-GlcNAc:betaGal beta-1,3-N-acetylglucosaminyltransferase-like protein 1 isoform X1 [Lacerta agilis]|uniref:UDP-GlcNAc:betaGal beta-1,3-N-acetylglucosaminyltransferase-like protein 1 isoform X1 n=1 Tax=Lacerta agilis TaxID=80427 RepID=UPI001419F28B|nr:UDP-GlcNAc:betaGal beta-1,3-N-acetylglucosaminyltransferase-like protein 1 isoform X1 [Lacerta agilis]